MIRRSLLVVAGCSPLKVAFEHIDPSSRTLRYRDPKFRPCAVICTICSGATTLDGLFLDRSYAGIDLYLETTPDSP
jgi:hypothetical protein